MRKSAVLALNPFLSQVIINHIFVQKGINATYGLSSFEGKRPGPVITFVQGIDSENVREHTVPGCPGAFHGLLYLSCSTTRPSTVNPRIKSPRRPQVTLCWCYHRLSKTLGKKLAPQWNLIFKPATINMALKFDNRELWQKIIRFAVKSWGKFPLNTWFVLSI